MPTAVALAVDYCFQVMRLHRIEIAIRPENTRSLRVVAKLGSGPRGCGRATCTSTATGVITWSSR